MSVERVIRQGDFYRHFKNKLYQIKEIAIHSETNDKMVVYQAMYGEFPVYVRSYDMFVSEVDHLKYPEIKQKYRFEKVEMGKADFLTDTLNDKETEIDTEIETEIEAQIQTEIVAQIQTQVQTQTENQNYNEYDDEDMEECIDSRLLKFLDARTYQEKLEVLSSIRNNVDDRILNDIAISLDVTVEDGPLDKKFDSLRNCLLAHVKYECNRLR